MTARDWFADVAALTTALLSSSQARCTPASLRTRSSVALLATSSTKLWFSAAPDGLALLPLEGSACRSERPPGRSMLVTRSNSAVFCRERPRASSASDILLENPSRSSSAEIALLPSAQALTLFAPTVSTAEPTLSETANRSSSLARASRPSVSALEPLVLTVSAVAPILAESVFRERRAWTTDRAKLPRAPPTRVFGTACGGAGAPAGPSSGSSEEPSIAALQWQASARGGCRDWTF
mmetsp:Transcript_108626/g.324840  ORF Transcript_108626/g.324840 Transcript_108626/m.324840 type:complete len:238 (+) Transcript_108626:916-1629(+)